MRTKNLALACGTMMSLVMAGIAVGQQDQPTRPARPADRTQPADRTITPPPSPSTPRTMNVPSVLRDLEGVWRVEVQCNHDHWSKMDSGMRPGDTTRQPNDLNRERDPENRDDPNRATEPPAPKPSTPSKETDPNNPNRIKDPLQKSPETTRPDTPGQPDRNTTKLANAKSYVGYAETKLVLGDNILQQKFVIPDMMMDGTGRTPQRIDGAPTPTTTGGEMFRGLSYLSFDSNSQKYHCVFMDSRNGHMHCDSGTYNESEKKIVFEGRKGNSSDKDMHGDHNVRVVVEVLSPTQHRVTMYNLDAGPAPTRTTPSNPSQPRDNTSIDSNIVYQALYTKASNDDSAKFRRLIETPGTTTTTTPNR